MIEQVIGNGSTLIDYTQYCVKVVFVNVLVSLTFTKL